MRGGVISTPPPTSPAIDYRSAPLFHTHSLTKGRHHPTIILYPHLVHFPGYLSLLLSTYNTSDTHRGSTIFAFAHFINAFHDHLPSQCITNGLALSLLILSHPQFFLSGVQTQPGSVVPLHPSLLSPTPQPLPTALGASNVSPGLLSIPTTCRSSTIP